MIPFLLLAAPAPVVPSDPLQPLYALIGSMVLLQIGGMVAGFVKWLTSRTVEREDRDKADARNRLDEHDKKFEEQERTLANLDRLLAGMAADGRSHHAAVESIRGSIAEIKGHYENRFDKQSEFYRNQLKETVTSVSEKLEKLEFQIRQDTTRAIHDAQAMRRGKG